ncbi:natural cytotoxicity triggering receptor 1-like isoform X2 [Ochotona curzoniae]|uniref:natural cytotoxicity triggering receptor 1-like isoform X2 n=1 Tax=Ochotona curzoniae TaxID=130825 RepID=UPI001B34772F|nr:natural cytotoxicity triggering receptor 1-like isoform X2 [Ochotona curzoniae]
MSPTLPVLLCLELCLSQMVITPKQNLARPIIWAEPAVLIPNGQPVAIFCQGAPGAMECQLSLEGSMSALGKAELPQGKRKVKFLLEAVTSRTAGRYSCSCRYGALWSEPSKPLDLMVTGLYDTPSLLVLPAPVVASGENVTFSCRMATGTGTFLLLREGRPGHTQARPRTAQAEFPLGPVTTAHRGKYRCYGSYNEHVWSFPSEPVTLLVTGDVGDSSLEPLGPPSTPASGEPSLGTMRQELPQGPAVWDHTTHNLLRLGMAVLILVAMTWLVAEDWRSRRRAQGSVGHRRSLGHH